MAGGTPLQGDRGEFDSLRVHNIKTKIIMETLKQIVKGTARLECVYGGGVADYIITSENNKRYLLQIDLSNKVDCGTGVFKKEEKAIFLMRWIRRAMESGELIEL